MRLFRMFRENLFNGIPSSLLNGVHFLGNRIGKAAVWLAAMGIGFLGIFWGGCGGNAGGKASVSPPSTEVRKMFEEGKKYLLDNNHAKAIDAFSQAIQVAPTYQQAYVWRGVAFQEIGQREKALKDFTKAIELDPTDNYALEQRAALYRKMGDSEKADADAERAAKLREKNREQNRKNVEEAKKRKKRS